MWPPVCLRGHTGHTGDGCPVILPIIAQLLAKWFLEVFSQDLESLAGHYSDFAGCRSPPLNGVPQAWSESLEVACVATS